jgi:hypothetical protein
MSGSDVKATYLTASGAVTSGPARLCTIHYHGAGSTGSVAFKDGGAAGPTLFTVDVHSNNTGQLNIPDEGVRFGTSIYAVLNNITSLTSFYK